MAYSYQGPRQLTINNLGDTLQWHFSNGGFMRKVPVRFQEFTKNYPRVAAAYEGLADECRRAGSLNERDQALVKLGIASGAQLEGMVRSQVRKGLDLGLRPDEIRHAIMLGLPSIGFAGMMAAFTWAEDVLKDETKLK
jgi:4-carboxymuconolactone decarboxylase